jgi:serine phosphatase RsbU (regulator of sigma subunit)
MITKITRSDFAVMVNITLVLLYITAVLVLIFLPIQLYAWTEKPFPGFVVEQTLLVGVYSGENWHSRLRMSHLQLVTALDDHKVRTLADYGRALQNFQHGEMIKVDVVNPDGGRSIYYKVALTEFPKKDLVRLFWLPFGIAVVYLLLGLWVFIRRGNSYSARAFAFFCLCIALGNVLLFDVVSTHIWVHLWSTMIAFLGGALVLLALFFPETLPAVRQKWWLTLLPMLVSLLLAVWSAVANFNEGNPWAYIIAWRANYIYAGIAAAFFIGMLGYRLRSGASPEVAMQLKVSLWGAFFAFTPVIFWFLAPLLGLDIPWYPEIFLPLLVIFPASISLGIVRHRLWDLEIIINQTLVYSTLTVTLGGIFLVGVVLIDNLMLGLLRERSSISVALSTVVITLLFNPLRNRIQVFIDRRFFRVRYDTNRALEAFSLSVRDKLDLNQLESELTQVIQHNIQPTTVAICTCKSDGTQKSFYIEEHDPLRSLLLDAQDALYVSRVNLDSPALEQLRQDRVELTIPLVNQGELIGVINLGPRRGGRPYTIDDRRLLQLLALQVAPALRLAQLVRQYREQEEAHQRMEREIELARQVQLSVLPANFPEFPGFRFAARTETARQVGGDFYDVICLDDDHFGIVVADVSDKGMPAALYMALTRSLLVSQARRELSPVLVLQDVNQLLQELSTADMFVTVFYGVVNRHTYSLRYARAGHDLPLLVRQGELVELNGRGMALGVFPGTELGLEEQELDLRHGDRLVLYTDGLTDVFSPEGEILGKERLLSFVLENAHLEPHEFSAWIFQHLADFRGAQDPFDDMTLLVVALDEAIRHEAAGELPRFQGMSERSSPSTAPPPTSHVEFTL